MRKLCVASAVVVYTVMLAIPAVRAQDLRVRGGSSPVLSAENNTTNSQDKIAVSGTSVPTPYYGIGGQFTGGYIGVRGYSLISGTGNRIGGYFYGTGGSNFNYGVWGEAHGPTGSVAYAGYFSGNVYVSGTITQTSDERLKLNTKDLIGSLDQIRRLKPKTYTFHREASSSVPLPSGTHIGFLAQELREVLPDLVEAVPVVNPRSESQKPTSDGNILSINYIELIPILVNAVQEQQSQIDELKAKVARLEAR